MNNRQREFLGNSLMIIGLGLMMMSISGFFIYFGKKLYGRDAMLLAVMGGVFCMGLISIAKVVGYSYSLVFHKNEER